MIYSFESCDTAIFIGQNGKISDLKFKFLFISIHGNNRKSSLSQVYSFKSDPEVQFRLKTVD